MCAIAFLVWLTRGILPGGRGGGGRANVCNVGVCSLALNFHIVTGVLVCATLENLLSLEHFGAALLKCTLVPHPYMFHPIHTLTEPSEQLSFLYTGSLLTILKGLVDNLFRSPSTNQKVRVYLCGLSTTLRVIFVAYRCEHVF